MNDDILIEIDGYIDKLRENLQGIFTDIKHNFGILNLSDDYGQENDDEFNNNDFEQEDADYDEEILTEEAQRELEYQDFIIKAFSKLRETNYEQYKFLISFLYHDYCLSINDEKELESHLNRLIKKYSNFEEIDAFLHDHKDYYVDFLEGFLNFSEMAYLEKRETFIDSSNIDKYLNKIFPLHYLDKLYYILPYNKQTLISIFEKYQITIFRELKVDAFSETISLITDLYYYDMNNYFNLMTSLLENYYKYNSYPNSYKILDKKNTELMAKITNWDLEPLLAEISQDYQFLEIIVDELYNDEYVYSDEYKTAVNLYYNNKTKAKVKNKLKVVKENLYEGQ